MYSTFFFAAAIPAAGHGTEIEDDLNTLLEDFTETGISITSDTPAASFFAKNINGYLKVFSAVNATHFRPEPDKSHWRGLSSLRLETMLEANYQLAGWKFFGGLRIYYDFAYLFSGRDNFTEEVLNSYERDLELREFYLEGSLTEHLDVKLGRQIVVWGRSDNLRVTDVLNPLDTRDAGITDIENIRLPLAMVKFDSLVADWGIELLAIFEHRYDENPVYGHYLYPANAGTVYEEKPAANLKNSEIGIELAKDFTSWDLSLYAAYLFDDIGVYTAISPPILEHERITMTGAGLGYARGNFLFIAELAHFNGLRFWNSEKDYCRTDALLGLEYSGLAETTISFDVAHRYLHHYEPGLKTAPTGPKERETEIALRLSRDYLHDRLELTALILLNGEYGENGASQRFTARYDLADNWSALAGMLLYQARDGFLAENGDTTRVFCELRYDF